MTTCYSMNWAISVVERFSEEYARATEIVYKVFGLTCKKCAYLLATRQFSRWDRIKRTIKLCARLMPADGSISQSQMSWLAYNLHTFQNQLIRPLGIGSLTNSPLCAPVVEQVVMGGPRKVYTPDGVQLLFDFGGSS